MVLIKNIVITILSILCFTLGVTIYKLNNDKYMLSYIIDSHKKNSVLIYDYQDSVENEINKLNNRIRLLEDSIRSMERYGKEY